MTNFANLDKNNRTQQQSAYVKDLLKTLKLCTRTGLHNAYKRDFGKHIPYSVIDSAFRKACRKWTVRNVFAGGDINVEELLGELTRGTMAILDKKYSVKWED
jgi:hypothetical protein